MSEAWSALLFFSSACFIAGVSFTAGAVFVCWAFGFPFVSVTIINRKEP
jgi:hypothetical protein